MLACNWISLGEASAPKKEPKMLVRELTWFPTRSTGTAIDTCDEPG